jgi:membrane protein implicated in regulation of membrane protease activity
VAHAKFAFMDPALAWAIAGLVLVIVELLTGTFYLLMLGVAAFGAAGAAWLGYDFSVQVIVAAVVAGVGCYGVHVYRAKSTAEQMAPIDAGMPASFESWVDAGARLARVRYRGASWDARVEGADALEPGATVYVLATDGNTLKVAKNRPA